MTFGNGKTSFKKAGFPDSGLLTLFDFPDQPVQVQKLGAGHSRDVYAILNGSGRAFIGKEDVVVKLEVQCPPNSCDPAVLKYGGRPDWRTNEHEFNAIGKGRGEAFSPGIVDPGLRYGHVTNRWGLATPVCALFLERLEKPDLQDVVDLAATLNRNFRNPAVKW